jgi:acyl-coenzyme A thioesterase PaaI-like protein
MLIPVPKMSEFEDDHGCFVCGSENPAGLKLVFRAGPDGVEADVAFPTHFQGWKDTAHGGLLATVLDEAMIKAAAAFGQKCVTAEISVRYKKPAATNTSYRLSGRLLDAKGRLFTAEACLEDASGEVYAQAVGKLFGVKHP